jgi:phage terminase large subunit-like protein
VYFQRVCELFGITPKPWQVEAANLIGEIDPVTGVHAYNTVTLSVGRRAGKTLFVFLYSMLQMLKPGAYDRRLFFTQQTQTDAALTMKVEWMPLVEASPAESRFRMPVTNGQELIAYRANASFLRLFKPHPKTLHGQSGDLIVCDEAWVHTATLGRDLETAIAPLTWTRPGGQFMIASAAGDVTSEWWNGWLEKGREAAKTDAGDGHLHIEYTGDIPGFDPDNRDLWAQANPGCLPLSVLESEWRIDRDRFIRTVLNVTDRDSSTHSPLSPDLWARHRYKGTPDYKAVIALAVDVADSQTHATIAVALNGGRVVEIVDSQPGVNWLMPRIEQLFDTYDIHHVIYDPGSPTGVLEAPLAAAGYPVHQTRLREVCNAAAGFVEACKADLVRHVSDIDLDSAVVGARKRPIGDGAWCFSRKTSTVDVTPLVAATLAWYGHPASHGALPPTIY